MPSVEASVPRAWRMTGEAGMIHYVLRVGGEDYHMIARRWRDRKLYDLLERVLLAQGYTGPSGKRRRRAREARA